MYQNIYPKFYPECTFRGPVDPLPFGHLGFTVSVPRKCIVCEFLFEGECTRAMEQLKVCLPLDFRPCSFTVETIPVFSFKTESTEMVIEKARAKLIEEYKNSNPDATISEADGNSFLKSVFWHADDPLEKWRESIDTSKVECVSCMDIVNLIRNKVAMFTREKGMVVLIIECGLVQIFFFDGISRMYWGYSNHQFNMDPVGLKFLLETPNVVALHQNTEELFLDLVKKEFDHYSLRMVLLYQLNPTDREYETFYSVSRNFSIQISIDLLPAT